MNRSLIEFSSRQRILATALRQMTLREHHDIRDGGHLSMQSVRCKLSGQQLIFRHWTKVNGEMP
jgi:hypothetical protein